MPIEVKPGDKFNRLEFLSLAGVHPKHKTAMWKVRCRCGTEFETAAVRVRSGKTKSCGCLQRETIGNMRRKHGACSGYKQSPLHAVWQAMIQRCINKNHKAFHHYGGRGITVCDRWMPDNDGFNNFLADMGARPEGKYTLERRKNELGYSPDNCYWATWNQQGSNKRNSRKLTYKDRTEICSEWARITGIPQRTILNRMNADKTPEEVLSPWSKAN